MANSIDVEPSTTNSLHKKYWNDNRDSKESYYKISIAIPFLDDINCQIRDGKKDQSHLEIFRLLPPVMFAKDYSTEESCEILLNVWRRIIFLTWVKNVV